ncbi:MAG: leucine-rich repeat domain-containing protein, partial [Erysipelotrichaceae bacterium]|nr:leucine-rich repeat domain-containing protein [Erysipelotrichaceae bacterium]
MKRLLLFILMVFLLFPANAYCEEDGTATDETTVEDAASEPIAEDVPISDTIDEGDTAEEAVTDNIECEEVASEETVTVTIEEELLESGICGDNAFYKIYPDYSMVIEGSGALYDQQNSSISLIRNIKTVTISEGITHLGSYSFYRFSALNEVNLPASLESIGAHAFDGASKLTSIYLPATITYLSGNNANDSAFYGTNAKLNVY